MRISGLVKFGGASSLGGATLAGFDLATAQAPVPASRASSTRSARRREAGVTPAQLTAGDPRDPAARDAGAHRRGAGARGREGHRELPQLPPGLPARVRRDRALRRQLRDRELALDHDRPAHPRARDAAHARRLAAPGARLDRRRGARDGRRAPRSSASSSGSGSAPASSSCSTPSASRCRTTASSCTPRTVVVSLLVGIVVTLVASLRPAFRATRVAPIAAVREGATLPESRFHRFRTPGSALLTAAGFAALVYGLFGSGLSTTQILVYMGLGTLLIFFGVALLSARFARPLAQLLGWPATQAGRARPARSPATTPGATRSGPPRPPPR